jgi:ribonuclease kappa
MFASGNHVVMGSSEDPKDGKSVAAAVFGAVVIYGVSSVQTHAPMHPSD